MNYNDEILENKAFNFFKQLMYNLALAICIILVGVLIAVYAFGFKLFEVLSDSQAPIYVKGDLVITKEKDEYAVGDILLFRDGDLNVTHRLLAIYEENGVKYYICHGDAVGSVNPANNGEPAAWEDDSKYVKDLIAEYGSLNNTEIGSKYPKNIQKITEDQINGTVINYISNLGSIISFIKEHYLLMVALITGIWCVSSVIQNEIDIKKSRRLE